jgi:transcription elongation GreA/GreB family factor
MAPKNMNKEKVYQALLSALTARGEALQRAWKELQESNQQEGKSSAGDKHETGAAMVHLEMEQMGRQLDDHNRQSAEVQRMAPSDEETDGSVRIGKMVATNKGWYYMITGFGKINVDGCDVWVISAQSPLGQAMLGRKKGEEFSWGNLKGRIEEVM